MTIQFKNYKNNLIFYFTIAACWSLIVFIKSMNYTYYGLPSPSAGIEGSFKQSSKQKEILLANTRVGLLQNLQTEKDPVERMHLYHNIGINYFDLYDLSQNRAYLDSALQFLLESVRSNPPIARFYYNLGKLFTEAGQHASAQSAYQRALQFDPKHIPALHNLALMTYFELHDPKLAQKYFAQGLDIDTLLPICNLVLGMIDMDAKKYSDAIAHFEKELAVDSQFRKLPAKYPISDSRIAMSESIAHYDLSLLYSTKSVNPQKAQLHFHAYLSMESNPEKRNRAITEMARYWVMQPGTPKAKPAGK